MNERNTHFLIKIYLSFYSGKGPLFVVVWEIDGETYTQRGLLLPISSSRNRGVPTLEPPCKLVRTASDRLRVPCPTAILCLCLNLTAWFSSRGLLPVTHLLYQSALIVLPYLLITMWRLVKAHGVTRNEPKIHGICYITNEPRENRKGKLRSFQISLLTFSTDIALVKVTLISIFLNCHIDSFSVKYNWRSKLHDQFFVIFYHCGELSCPPEYLVE